jgi:hypothetical protein
MGVVKNYRESLASLSSELACPDQAVSKLASSTLDAPCYLTLTLRNMSDAAVMDKVLRALLFVGSEWTAACDGILASV